MSDFISVVFYRKNVSNVETLIRFVLGAALCAIAFAFDRPLMGVAALYVVATAFFGFCPACYLFGRRSLSERRVGSPLAGIATSFWARWLRTTLASIIGPRIHRGPQQ